MHISLYSERTSRRANAASAVQSYCGECNGDGRPIGCRERVAHETARRRVVSVLHAKRRIAAVEKMWVQCTEQRQLRLAHVRMVESTCLLKSSARVASRE